MAKDFLEPVDIRCVLYSAWELTHFLDLCVNLQLPNLDSLVAAKVLRALPGTFFFSREACAKGAIFSFPSWCSWAKP
jgi:hypothetical protein